MNTCRSVQADLSDEWWMWEKVRNGSPWQYAQSPTQAVEKADSQQRISWSFFFQLFRLRFAAGFSCTSFELHKSWPNCHSILLELQAASNLSPQMLICFSQCSMSKCHFFFETRQPDYFEIYVLYNLPFLHLTSFNNACGVDPIACTRPTASAAFCKWCAKSWEPHVPNPLLSKAKDQMVENSIRGGNSSLRYEF